MSWNWEALGTWFGVVVAGVAAYFIWVQIRDARRAATEAQQPNVVVLFESSPASPQVIELAIKNFGATPARDIRTQITPRPRRSGGGAPTEDVWIPEEIPFLAPGQEWRTTWDFAPRRATSSLDTEDRHVATVTFDGLEGTDRRTTQSVLDWSAFKHRRYIDRKTTHHAAEALREIHKLMKRWSEGNQGLGVVVRDGDALGAQERAEIEEYMRARNAEATALPEGFADGPEVAHDQ